MQSELSPIADGNRLPHQFSELAGYAFDEIARLIPDLDERKSRLLAIHIVSRLAREYGGTSFYVPKPDAIDRALRDMRIWAEFDGTVSGPNGRKMLAIRHRMTEQGIWLILRKQRDLSRSPPASAARSAEP